MVHKPLVTSNMYFHCVHFKGEDRCMAAPPSWRDAYLLAKHVTIYLFSSEGITCFVKRQQCSNSVVLMQSIGYNLRYIPSAFCIWLLKLAISIVFLLSFGGILQLELDCISRGGRWVPWYLGLTVGAADRGGGGTCCAWKCWARLASQETGFWFQI